MEISRQILEPARPPEVPPKSEWRLFPAAEWPQDERRPEPAKDRRVPHATQRDMVDDVKLCEIVSPSEVRGQHELPKQVDDLPGQWSKPCRAGLVTEPRNPIRREYVDPEVGWKPPTFGLPSDRCLTLGLSNHDDVVALPGGLQRPVPSNPGFRALARPTGKGAHEYSHLLALKSRLNRGPRDHFFIAQAHTAAASSFTISVVAPMGRFACSGKVITRFANSSVMGSGSGACPAKAENLCTGG